MQGDMVRAKEKTLRMSKVHGAAFTYKVGIDSFRSKLKECMSALMEMVFPFPFVAKSQHTSTQRGSPRRKIISRS